MLSQASMKSEPVHKTKHFFGATLSFDVVYLLLSALCRIDPCCMLNVVVAGVLATF